jgi:outer membrane autotransporter protein
MGGAMASRGGFDISAAGGVFGGAPAASMTRPAVWLQGIGAWQNLRTDGNAPGLKQDIGGVIGGIDINPFGESLPDLKSGVAASYTRSRLGPGSENGTTDAYRIALYATHPMGPAYVEGSAGYGRLNMTTTRAMDFFGIIPSMTATGSATGDEWSTSIGAGYRHRLGSAVIEPSVSLAYQRETRAGFTETGANFFDLTFQDSAIESLRFSGGVRLQTTVQFHNGLVARPELRARYLHDFRDLTPATTFTFGGLQDFPFIVHGVRVGRDAAVLGAGITMGHSDKLALFGDYNAELRSLETVQTIKGGLRIQW